MTKNRVYKTGICEIVWDNRGFIRLKLFETQNTYGLKEAKCRFEIVSQITEGKEYKVLIDARGTTALPDKEAHDYTVNAPLRIAEAIIVDSLSMRILSKFYMKKNKRNKVKIFSNEKNAIDWLVNFSKE